MKPSCRGVLGILTVAALAIDARPAGAQPKVAVEQIGPLEVVRASVSRVLTIVQAPYPGASGGSQRRAKNAPSPPRLFRFRGESPLVLAPASKARLRATPREAFPL